MRAVLMCCAAPVRKGTDTVYSELQNSPQGELAPKNSPQKCADTTLLVTASQSNAAVRMCEKCTRVVVAT